jgi:hypothetical protein
VAVADDLGRGLVDQPDPVAGIDHQQALAQVLHDVLGQFGEIRQIDVLLADQVLAFAHAAGHETGGRGDRE